jgi:Cysteine-rich domain
MRVGLMIPCYVDAFYPEVGIATLELLEKLGVDVEYPFDQTCCGQPMANSGCESDARATEELCVGISLASNTSLSLPAVVLIISATNSLQLPRALNVTMFSPTFLTWWSFFMT